jgi:hypothetical protein
MDSRWKWDCERRYSRGIKGGEELVGRTAHGDGRLEPQEQGGDTRMYAEFEVRSIARGANGIASGTVKPWRGTAVTATSASGAPVAYPLVYA